MTALTGRLTAAEVDFLAQCEDTIQAGLHTFVEVGNAFAAVRDNRLYRATHASFEVYCAEKWAVSHRHVNRMIEAANVADGMGPMGPTNERQARELAAVPSEQRAEVWAETVVRTEGRAPTAAAIRETAASRNVRHIPAPPASPSLAPAPLSEAVAAAIEDAADRVARTKPDEPGVPTVNDTLREYVNADPQIQAVQYMKRFGQALSQAGRVVDFQPERVAQLAETHEVDLLVEQAKSLSAFADKVVRARRGLRLIKGEAQ